MIKYSKGDVVKATITAVEDYGAFASIDETYSGLIHISEITEKFVRDINDFLEVGDVVNVKILDVLEKTNQLKLSIKDIDNNLEKNRNKKIKETIFGFYLLKTNLPSWIEQKMSEINKKN